MDTEVNILVSPNPAQSGFIQSFNKHLMSIDYRVGFVLGAWMTRQGLYCDDPLYCVQI